MIVNVENMKKIESESGLDTFELMNLVGLKVKDFLIQKYEKNHKILILCGVGNNGGDGLVIGKLLHELNYDVKICLTHDEIKSKTAKLIYDSIDKNIMIKRKSLKNEINKSDVLIDCIYGFGFHGILNEFDKSLFEYINKANKEVISIDVNSGVEADGNYYDKDAIVSKYTLALECYKPFHKIKKDHNLFENLVLIDLGLNHDIESNYIEMDKNKFLENYPIISENSYKGKNGRALLIGGGWGMAGALGLNIIGALSCGSTYLNVSTDESCYPCLASRFLTCVYHPFNEYNWEGIIKSILKNNNSIAFGSGSVRLPAKNKILNLLLESVKTTLVLDAEAINLLSRNYYVLNLTKAKVVLTPHIKEFSRLIDTPIEVIMQNKFEIAKDFCEKHNVILVLKGVHTIVVSNKYIYINQTGNQILARAGSGDLLTGMITALTSIISDTYLATIMAVWLHGYIADIAKDRYAISNFQLENYQELLEEFFYKNNL